MDNSFQIFERNTRLINPTRGNILFLSMVILLLFSSLFGKIYPYLNYPAAISTIVYFIYLYTECTRIQYLKGKFTGTLIFNENNLVIKERKLIISEIQQIHLRADDYEGRERSGKPSLFIPKSNGTNNLLHLTLKSGEIIKVFFKMEFMDYEDLKPFVISLLQYEIITIDKALEILKIDDNYFIDKFKLELNKKEPE
jgi:hypothetical protein